MKSLALNAQAAALSPSAPPFSQKGGSHGQRNIATRDTAALTREIRSAKRRFRLPEDTRTLSCYQASREGSSRKDIGAMWLQWYLMNHGVGNVVVDAGSLEASKKRRRVTPALTGGARETDSVDLEKLLRMLIR